MIAICEVVHGLELFIDDTDAGVVGTNLDILDIFRGLAHLGECGVYVLGGLDGSLGVEFS